jgi:trigger factor
LVLKFTVPLSPTVNLGDYRAIRKEIEPIIVEEKAVDEALEQLQTRRQKLETVERPAELGDVTKLSGVGKLVNKVEVVAEVEETAESDDVPAESESTETETAESHEPQENEIFHEHGRDFVLDSFKLFAGTPFVENIVGMAAGEEKTFTFTFPEDYEEQELASKEASFTITVDEVKKRELPELNDEFAKQEGNHETVEDLRASLRADLHKAAEVEANDKRLESLVDDLMEQVEMVYPPAALKAEVDSMVEDFKGQVTRANWQWEDFLRIQNQTEVTLRKDFEETAVKRLRRRLVLQQFIADEKLRIQEEDLDEAIEKRISNFKNEELQQNMRDYYRNNEYARSMVLTDALMDKVHERVKLVLTGNAPDLTEKPETDEPATEETTSSVAEKPVVAETDGPKTETAEDNVE